MGSGHGIAAAVVVAALLGASEGPAEARTASLIGSFPIVELRQYTLHDRQRDMLIDLFEREFVESQEAVGMKVIGTFTDLDRPNRFVWLRGYGDMDSRFAGLTAFYGGPVWKAHRNAANSTMIDSDDVLLLRAPGAAAQFKISSSRPSLGEEIPAGLVVATIHHLKGPLAEAASRFESDVKPRLEQAGVELVAWLVPETAANNFPALPVREGERILVWFARFDGLDDFDRRKPMIEAASAPLAALSEREPEVLRLKPTLRSELR